MLMLVKVHMFSTLQPMKINIGREFERSSKVDLFPLPEHRRSINLKGWDEKRGFPRPEL